MAFGKKKCLKCDTFWQAKIYYSSTIIDKFSTFYNKKIHKSKMEAK